MLQRNRLYKSTLKEALLKLLNEFFAEERGNRLTSNNIEGLAVKINTLLEQHIEKEDSS